MNRFETKLFGYHYSLTKEYGKYLKKERKKKNGREEYKSRTVSGLQSKTANRRK